MHPDPCFGPDEFSGTCPDSLMRAAALAASYRYVYYNAGYMNEFCRHGLLNQPATWSLHDPYKMGSLSKIMGSLPNFLRVMETPGTQ